MTDVEVLPELKQILGALLFAARTPLTLAEVKRVLKDVAEQRGGAYRDFASVSEKDLSAAMDVLKRELEQHPQGFHVAEVANGYRLQNDPNCGAWLRRFLDKGRANRLTKPALETLAIVAYRQPCTRGEIEGVRGVAVDQMIRNLLDMQLVRIVGRSELPGRPWLFGTTQKFLEHFGLNDVKDLPGVEELKRMELERAVVKSDAKEEEEAVHREESEGGPGAKEEVSSGQLAVDSGEGKEEVSSGQLAVDSEEEEEVEDEYEDDDDDDDDDDEEEEEEEDEKEDAEKDGERS